MNSNAVSNKNTNISPNTGKKSAVSSNLGTFGAGGGGL